MNGRRLSRVVIVVGLIGFAATIAIPGVAYVLRAGLSWRSSSTTTLQPSARELGLLIRTVSLAAGGAIGAMVLSLPGAFVVGRLGRSRMTSVLVVLVLAPVLIPPLVSAIGWQRFLGAHFSRTWSPLLRCVWMWSAWSWPLPAVLLGSGWSRTGRDVYESASLVLRPRAAFCRAVLPSLMPHAVAGALLLFVFFMGEYSVPHTNGVMVVSTELLAVAQFHDPSDVALATLRFALPPALLIVAAMYIARLLTKSRGGPRVNSRSAGAAGPGWGAVVLVSSVVAVTAVLPVLGVVSRSTLLGDLSETYSTYRMELVWSVLVCATAAALVAVVGLAVTAVPWIRGPAIAVTLAAGVLPGAVVGEMVLAAYQPVGAVGGVPLVGDGLAWVYDHWPILVIALAARFAWIGVLAAWLAGRSLPQDLYEHARMTLGDHRWVRLFLQLSHAWPTLLCGFFLVLAFSMSEVAVVSIVGVPWPTMIATIVLEKFHRFEDGMLAALCLWLLVGSVPVFLIASVALTRKNR